MSDKKKDNEPLMWLNPNGKPEFIQPIGLTTREHFAMMAMHALLSRPIFNAKENLTLLAVDWADALIAELANKTE